MALRAADSGQKTYSLQALMNQRDQKGRKSLTAQQMAVMTREYGESALMDHKAEDSGEELSFDDNTGSSRRAKWFGFFSWVGGLFSEDIHFHFNGTQIKGKDKHQVRGGPVPLFNGVVLDLTPASMTGVTDGKDQLVYPRQPGGTPAKLVVSIAKLDHRFIRECDIKTFEIGAPVNENVNRFRAEIEESIDYPLGNNVWLQADGATLDRDSMKLEKPRIVRDRDEITYETAEIGGEGLRLTGGKTGTDKSGEEPEKETEDSEKGSEEGDEEGRSFVDVKKAAFSYSGEDNSANLDLHTGDAGFSKGDLEVTGNIFKGTVNIGFGKGISSEDEGGEEDQADQEAEKEKSVKEAIKEYCSNLLKEGADVAEKIGFAGSALLTFLQTGKLPENKYEEEGKDKDETEETGLTAVYPLIPFLNFKASLIPFWKFGYHIGFQLTEGEAPAFEVRETNGRISVSCPDVKRKIILTGSLNGKIGAKLKLALAAGLGYLFDIDAGLFAEGGVKGILEGGEEDIFGSVRREIPITVGDSGIRIDGQDPNLLIIQGGLGLFGSVGGFVAAESTIFGWSDELWNCTFGKWEPAQLKGTVQLRKKKGVFGEGKSWECEKTDFRFQAFKTKIDKSTNFGIKTAHESAREKILIEEGGVTQEKIEKLHANLQEIEDRISKPGGGQFGSADSEAYRTLKEQLGRIRAHLSLLHFKGQVCYDQMNEEIERHRNDKTYQESLKQVTDKIARHETRKKGMETWGEKFGEGEKKGAFDYYQKTFDAKRAVKKQDQARTAAAKSRVATKENLIAYETTRIRKLGKKYDEHIRDLKGRINRLEGMPEDKKQEMSRKLVDEYRKKEGGELLRFAPRYAGKDRIIRYEQQRQSTYRSRHLTRFQDLKNKAKEYGISDENKKQPNRKFAAYYYEELKARRFFRKEELLNNHQSGEELLNYEEERLKAKAKRYKERIDLLGTYKGNYDAAQDQEDRDAITGKAREEYSNEKGELGRVRKLNINVAKAASKEEILAYEDGKAKNGSKKMPGNYKLVKKVLEAIHKGGDADPQELIHAEAICLKWMGKKLSDEEEDKNVSLLQEIIPLESLQKYENEIMDIRFFKKRKTVAPMKKKELQGELEKRLEELRKEKESNPDLKAPEYNFEKMSRDDLITEVTRLRLEKGEDKEYNSHYRRHDYLARLGEKIKDLDDVDKESELLQSKQEYFKKYLMDEDGKLNEEGKSVLKWVSKGSRLMTPELREIMMERMMEGFEEVHKERCEKLREFMGLEEHDGAEKSSKTDAQVWDYYRSIGGGHGFADDYVRKKKGKYSIDEMLRYEEYEARAHSGKNGIKTLIEKRKIKAKGDFLSKDGSEEQLKEFERLKAEGSHYERYLELKKAVDSGKTDREIVEIYRKLGGGDGYAEALTGGDMLILDVVTPQEILDYEAKWSGKKGAVHGERLEKMKGFDKELSDEKFYDEYRKMVLEESEYKQAADKITKGAVSIDFDRDVKVEDVLTPELILRYEERCRAEVTGKHQARLDRLQQKDVTDEDAWKIYSDEEGGGKGFFKEKASQLSLERSILGEKADYQSIIAYEDSRIQYYREAEREITGSLRKITEAQEKLGTQIRQAEEDMKHMETILNTYEKKPPYESGSTLRDFKEKTTGPEVGKKVAEAGKIDQISEEQKENLDQIRAAEVKVLLDDEKIFLTDNNLTEIK